MSLRGYEGIAKRISRRARDARGSPARSGWRPRVSAETYIAIFTGSLLIALAWGCGEPGAWALTAAAAGLFNAATAGEVLRRAFFGPPRLALRYLPVDDPAAFRFALRFAGRRLNGWGLPLAAVFLWVGLAGGLEPSPWWGAWAGTGAVAWTAALTVGGLFVRFAPRKVEVLGLVAALGFMVSALVQIADVTQLVDRAASQVALHPLAFTPFGWAAYGLLQARASGEHLWLLALLPLVGLALGWPRVRRELARVTTDDALLQAIDSLATRARSGGLGAAAAERSPSAPSTALTEAETEDRGGGAPSSPAPRRVVAHLRPPADVDRITRAWWTPGQRWAAAVLREPVPLGAGFVAAILFSVVGAVVALAWPEAPLWVLVLPGLGAAFGGLPFLSFGAWAGLRSHAPAGRLPWLLPIRVGDAWRACLKEATVRTLFFAPLAIAYVTLCAWAQGADPWRLGLLLGLKAMALILVLGNVALHFVFASPGRPRRVLGRVLVACGASAWSLAALATATFTLVAPAPISWGCLILAAALGYALFRAAEAIEPHLEAPRTP